MSNVKVFDAVERDDIEKVKAFIESGRVLPTIYRRHSSCKNETLAHVATKRGNLNMVKYLLEKDSSFLKNVDYYMPTILETAVEYGHLGIVKYLVERHNDDIFQERPKMGLYNDSPVSLAISNGHLNIIKYFIEERHVDVNTGTPNKDPLPDHHIAPPLFQAVMFEHQKIVNYLIEEKNANLTMVGKKNQNILYLAVMKKDLNFIKYVLDEKKANIDINWTDEEGQTLVYCAVHGNCLDIVQYLVEQKKADINIPHNRNSTPLHDAVFNSNDDVFIYLVDHGADLEKKDKYGSTVLHLAAFQPYSLNKCKYLLEHGANMSQENNAMKTPLQVAIENNNYNASTYLIDYSRNDDMNGTNNNYDDIYTTIRYNRIEILDYLVSKRHAQVDIQKDSGFLFSAACEGHKPIIKYLMEHGADSYARNEYGATIEQTIHDAEVINYIEQVRSSMRRITRRSIGRGTRRGRSINYTWIPSPQPELHRYEQSLPIQRLYKNVATISGDEIQKSYFQDFLTFANFIIQYLFQLPTTNSEYNHLSSIGRLQNRMDHTAEDAIHTFQALEEKKA